MTIDALELTCRCTQVVHLQMRIARVERQGILMLAEQLVFHRLRQLFSCRTVFAGLHAKHAQHVMYLRGVWRVWMRRQILLQVLLRQGLTQFKRAGYKIEIVLIVLQVRLSRCKLALLIQGYTFGIFCILRRINIRPLRPHRQQSRRQYGYYCEYLSHLFTILLQSYYIFLDYARVLSKNIRFLYIFH